MELILNYFNFVVYHTTYWEAIIVELFCFVGVYFILFRGPLVNLLFFREKETKQQRKEKQLRNANMSKSDWLIRFIKWLFFCSYRNRPKRFPHLYIVVYFYNLINLISLIVFLILCLINLFVDVTFISRTLAIAQMFIFDGLVMVICTVLVLCGYRLNPDKFFRDKRN